MKDYSGTNISLSTNQESEKSIETFSKYENNISILFKKNPNLKYKENIIYDNDSIGFNDLFDIFSSITDGKLYIISPNKIFFSLDIYLLDNPPKLIKSLKGHNNHITMVKYYYYSNNLQKEYIISADINGVIIIWEINDINNYKKYEIKLKLNDFIYSCLMFFEGFNYIITSTCGNEETKLFKLKDNNIKFVQNIKYSKNNNVYYLLIWYNKLCKQNHLIQFCKKKIVINNINKNEIYWNLTDQKNKDARYMNGFIYTNNNYKSNENFEYLYTASMNGYINIWELNQKILLNTIFINNNFLSNIIQWNENYIILTNGNKNNILIMELNNTKIISSIFSKHEKGIMNIKKIIHPIYGESLLSCGLEGDIFLWNI